MKLITRKLIGCDYLTVQRSAHASVYNAHMALSLNCDALIFIRLLILERFSLFLTFIFAL
jgi:hypothetical protein